VALQEIASVALVFVLLCGSAALGVYLRPRLPARHRTRESVELMQVAIALLATFAAIVLGLVTTSVKTTYDGAARDRQEYAQQLTLLDRCLRDYGTDSAAARGDLHSYTAAVIASTWPDEPPPIGVRYPDITHMPRVGASPVLAALMDRVGVEISRLAPEDAVHTRLLELCLDRYRDVVHARVNVIEDAGNVLFQPFYQVLVFWLMVIFLCFGLVAPFNSLSAIIIVLAASSLSSVMFVILDLSRPYAGYFAIPSTTMRNALNAMIEPMMRR
jgi:hypothetical protein